MLKELSEDLSSLKKIQSETKDTLIEIKNDLQGNNSRVDEAENQINNMEHKEAKNNQSEQEEEKRLEKNQDKQPLGQLQEVQLLHHGMSEEKRKSKKLEIYLKK